MVTRAVVSDGVSIFTNLDSLPLASPNMLPDRMQLSAWHYQAAVFYFSGEEKAPTLFFLSHVVGSSPTCLVFTEST